MAKESGASELLWLTTLTTWGATQCHSAAQQETNPGLPIAQPTWGTHQFQCWKRSSCPRASMKMKRFSISAGLRRPQTGSSQRKQLYCRLSVLHDTPPAVCCTDSELSEPQFMPFQGLHQALAGGFHSSERQLLPSPALTSHTLHLGATYSCL